MIVGTASLGHVGEAVVGFAILRTQRVRCSHVQRYAPNLSLSPDQRSLGVSPCTPCVLRRVYAHPVVGFLYLKRALTNYMYGEGVRGPNAASMLTQISAVGNGQSTNSIFRTLCRV